MCVCPILEDALLDLGQLIWENGRRMILVCVQRHRVHLRLHDRQLLSRHCDGRQDLMYIGEVGMCCLQLLQTNKEAMELVRPGLGVAQFVEEAGRLLVELHRDQCARGHRRHHVPSGLLPSQIAPNIPRVMLLNLPIFGEMKREVL